MNLEIITILKIFILLIFTLLVRSFIHIYLFKIFNVNLTLTKSIEIISKTSLLNSIFPLNVGTAYKMKLLKSEIKLSYSSYISINSAYSVLNIFLNFLIMNLVLIEYLQTENIVKQNLFYLSSTTLLGLIFFTYFCFKLNEWSLNNSFVKNIIQTFFGGFKLFFINKLILIKVSIFSIIFIAINLLIYKIVLEQFGSIFLISDLIVLFNLSSIVNLIKLTPGNIGFLEAVLINSEVIHGILPLAVFGLSIVLRIVNYFVLLTLLTTITILKILKK